MENNVKIMDVTLRDGSYAVNFQFSQYDTEKICAGLYSAGIDYIEVGHGMGLDAGSPRNGQALCSDSEYLSAANAGAPKAKYGMFCMPSYARLDSICKLKEFGASFVRVGTDATEVESSAAFIRRAKSVGLEVMVNYMKSYAVPPGQFAENVKKSESYGADVVYIVDSAGGMGGGELESYYDAARRVSGVRIGFHGHNNLGRAVSNSMAAVELGFDLVDTSLLGMGRSAGNAATELLIGNLVRFHGEERYDLKQVMRCAEQYVRPMWGHGANVLDLYCGIAQFHTSYMKYIHKYAVKYRVNPLDLILNYSRYDKVNLDEQLLERVASKMDKDEACNITEFGFNKYIGNEQVKG